MNLKFFHLLTGNTSRERAALAAFLLADNRLTLPPVLLAAELFRFGARIGLRATLGEGYAASRLLRVARRLGREVSPDTLRAEYARYIRRSLACPEDFIELVVQVNSRALPSAEAFARQLVARGVFLLCPDEVRRYTLENRAIEAVGETVQPYQSPAQHSRNLGALGSALAAIK